MKRFFGFSVFIFFLTAQSVQAQSIMLRSSDSASKTPVRKIIPQKPKPIRTELSAGFKLNTDGWSIFVDKGYVKSDDYKNSDRFYNIRLFYIELSEKKHPKEIKEPNTELASGADAKPKQLIYGKINNFYPVKLGYGYRRMIAGKPDPGTISIHWVYAGGVSVGLLKPYYVDAYVFQDNTGFYERKSIKYSEETKEEFLSKPFIIGSSGVTKGLNELQVIPGIHAKTGLSFDFAASHKTRLAIEIGIAGDIYTSKIELMANQKAFPYFTNAYVSFQLGKRW